MGNIKQSGLSKEIFDQKRLKGGDWWKLSRRESLGFMAEWMNVGGEGRMKALDSVSQEMLLTITLTWAVHCIRTRRLKMTLGWILTWCIRTFVPHEWPWMDLRQDHFVPVVTWWRRIDGDVFCGPFVPLQVSRLRTLKIMHIWNTLWSYLPSVFPLLPLTPTEHFLPDKFPSYFHVFWVCCVGPLHYLGLAAQTRVGHYLLKHGQHTSGYNAEENDSASPKNHYLSPVPQGRMERHEPFPEPWWNIVRPNHVQAPGWLVHKHNGHALALETHYRLKTGFHNTFPTLLL